MVGIFRPLVPAGALVRSGHFPWRSPGGAVPLGSGFLACFHAFSRVTSKAMPNETVFVFLGAEKCRAAVSHAWNVKEKMRDASMASWQQKSRKPDGYAAFENLLLGAQEGTRTPTVLPPLGPEPSASTNFATWAFQRRPNSKGT